MYINKATTNAIGITRVAKMLEPELSLVTVVGFGGVVAILSFV